MTMDLCLDGRLYHHTLPHTRHFQAREYKMQWSYKPFVNQRPRTSYSVRDAFSPSPRIQSAHAHISMTATPRSQVSMAGFYDWSASDETAESSMSTIYRKIASLSQKGKLGSKSNKNWCADGVHMSSPGRMFLRGKADLTKGEREIIAGIYKNRSDTNKDNKNGNVNHIKSHKDAWLIGKRISRRAPQIDYQDDSSFKVPDHLFSKMDSPKQTNSATVCYMCIKCRDDCVYHKKDKEEEPSEDKETKHNKKVEIEGHKAPPSSPSNSPKTGRRHNKLVQDNMAEGAIFIEAGKTFYDPEEKARKKKVFVDVFLPKFPSPTLNEEVTNLDLKDESCDTAYKFAESEKILQAKTDKKAKVSEDIHEKQNQTTVKFGYTSKQTKSSSNSSSRAASSSGE